MTDRPFHAPIWDRGEAVDPEMLAFTAGDDWQQDRRLVLHDLRGSIAHAAGLERIGLLSAEDGIAIREGLYALLREHRAGQWTVEAGDEDVHSAVERRLIEKIGDAGKRLHTGRSRNDQIALDVRLWLRDAVARTSLALAQVTASLHRMRARFGEYPMPGYTHLRRAMPSTVDHWAHAHEAALLLDDDDLEHVRRRSRRCPLGSGAGYGIPLQLDREYVAMELGFEGPEEPVTLTQHARGRAELAYLTALEAIALDLGKMAHDLWLYSTHEFGFVKLPAAFTTGSSLMPQKRNPDVLEILRAQSRQVVADRAALLDVVRDLPSGYHRDFQLIKPPLFRAHDRAIAMLSITARLLDRLEWQRDTLEQACSDPALRATERALLKAKAGVPFRDAYREESRGAV
ncbi:MAG: argininosuccinate lyase [Planctomycetes bacterium]|nr:argininosuccinate lyase [Planctomycetota bacterium]